LSRPPRSAGLFTRWLANRLRDQLALVNEGHLTLVDGSRRWSFGDRRAPAGLRATLTVHDPAFYRGVALRGSIGAAETWIAGQWECDDLTALTRILVRNREALDGVDGVLARLSQPWLRLRHRLRRNNRTGSRRNISAHYDLGNAFFELFLDETMMYSCAIFEREDATLAEASRAKNERICRKLDLGPDDHLLEIGTGWGGFAEHAARQHGCRVTTTTISREQHALAVERIRAAGLADRVEVLLCDYRDLQGQYDKLVSIEMIEAVGHEHYDAFFAACGRLLKPEGLMLLQGIVIADHEFERTSRSVDFIQHYVFPGSCLPSVAALCGAVARSTKLRPVHLEDIGPHYVRTLREWRRNLQANVDRARALGCTEEFLRLWDFYLCYCEGGFAERHIGDVQLLLAGPRSRRAPILPGLGRQS
jgi:cyclopropane-fatty-acyl-phospholipid synthase